MILSLSASLIDISDLGMVALLYSPALSWKVPILLQLEAYWSIIFPSEQSVVSLKSILFIFLTCNATISNTQWTTHKDKVKRWIEGSKIKRNGKKVWKYAHACITCLKIELESLFDIEFTRKYPLRGHFLRYLEPTLWKWWYSEVNLHFLLFVEIVNLASKLTNLKT